MKLAISPFAYLAGFLGKKAFAGAWRLIGDDDPPRPERRQASLPKLIGALVLEGAIVRLSKGLADRGARGVLGTWPDEGSPPASSE